MVGGGITGLAAAWQAIGRGDVDVTVLEATDRVGGKIRTSDLDLGDGHRMRSTKAPTRSSPGCPRPSSSAASSVWATR